jgi:hypothetical protein
MAYMVTVKLVNEGLHEDEQQTFEAEAVTLDENGRLEVVIQTGSASFGATTWGNVTIARVLESDGA